MSGLKNIMIFGAGGSNIGRFITEAFIKEGGFNVSTLSRKSSQSTYPSSVKNVRVDDSLPHDQLVAAMKGQDVVISAVGLRGGALPLQIQVIDAAVEAGVKRFFPSEYGFDNADDKTAWLVPPFKIKQNIEHHLNAKVKENPGFSWTAVATSIWLEWALDVVFIGIDPVKHTVAYWDNGTHTPTVSTLPYSALGVVESIKHAEETKNKRIFLDPLKASQREVVAELERQQGVKYTELEPVVGTKAIEEAHKKWADSGETDIPAVLTTVTAQILVEEYGTDFKKARKGPILEDFVKMPKITLPEVVKMYVEQSKEKK
ncbi:hypothetical protein PRZ48_004874 [Zasmidium cellare]|uniref:NmrA-like domain-containing protein n=1 Tax=Zasmidium cellare TaxID=395010 RepID=A0ABR0EQT0_ZASCE|nr:hypothetical protein PRZ48_004874 [Zasmidium cellare]